MKKNQCELLLDQVDGLLLDWRIAWRRRRCELEEGCRSRQIDLEHLGSQPQARVLLGLDGREPLGLDIGRIANGRRLLDAIERCAVVALVLLRDHDLELVLGRRQRHQAALDLLLGGRQPHTLRHRESGRVRVVDVQPIAIRRARRRCTGGTDTAAHRRRSNAGSRGTSWCQESVRRLHDDRRRRGAGKVRLMQRRVLSALERRLCRIQGNQVLCLHQDRVR